MKPPRWLSPLQLRLLLWILLTATLTLPACAHVGNKDVFEQISAGPYRLFVTIRTPNVIPGVAVVEVRSSGAPIDALSITPLLLTGEASRHPPTADAMTASPADPAFYTGSLWLMGSGSWQVRFTIQGAAGAQVASVAVPAAPTALLRMQRPLGMVLAILGLILVFGMVGIVVAAVREARLPPGTTPDAERRQRSILAGGLAFIVAVAAVVGGGYWWHVEAADYAGGLYRSSELRPTLQGNTLHLLIAETASKATGTKGDGASDAVKNQNLLLDHGHLMHLYAIREPQMDAVFHLHPEAVGATGLQMTLPAMPPGTYRLFADIVYRNGFPETETAILTIPAGLSTASLAAEDASARPAPLSAGVLGPADKLPDGYTMVWDRPATITAGQGYQFRFHLLNPQGQPAQDVQPYLGMAGHAAFVKSDFSAFAHTHPEGSAAMPAMMLADQSTAAMTGGASSMNMAGAATGSVRSKDEPLSSTVEFPYGFPSAGRYRIFVQMKHGSTVETGVFDAEVQ